MHFPFSVSLFLAIAGVTLLALEATGRTRNPLLAAGGIMMAVAALIVRLVSAGGIGSAASGLFLDFGIAFLLGAVVLLAKRRSARPFVMIGAGALLLGSVGKIWSGLERHDSSTLVEVEALLVELGEDDDISEINDVLLSFGATYEKAFPDISLAQDSDLSQVYLVHLPFRSARELLEKLTSALLADVENVDFVEANRTVSLEPPVEDVQHSASDNLSTALRIANDPLTEAQWALSGARIDEAHGVLAQASPQRKAVVAILDTGVDARHEDIRGTFLTSPAADDAHGHGTHCAGIAGAATNNGVGMASLNWEGNFVEVTSYRALSSSGMGTIESIAQAIIDATTDGADVISMSLGDYSPTPPRVIRDAVKFALRRDVIVVAAAGNSNQDAAAHMPANIDGVIAVSAVDSGLRKAKFSNTNTSLAMPIAAPGVDILSLVPNGDYGKKSGTSMATPLVAGLLGVMRSLNPSLTADMAYRILVDSGQDVADTPSVGKVIDAHGAITSVLKIAS